MAVSAELRAQVEGWIDDDPDAATRGELELLLEQASQDDAEAAVFAAELADAFSGLLQFGTAGLRGRMAGGPARMNRAVVIRATRHPPAQAGRAELQQPAERVSQLGCEDRGLRVVLRRLLEEHLELAARRRVRVVVDPRLDLRAELGGDGH